MKNTGCETGFKKLKKKTSRAAALKKDKISKALKLRRALLIPLFYLNVLNLTFILK